MGIKELNKNVICVSVSVPPHNHILGDLEAVVKSKKKCSNTLFYKSMLTHWYMHHGGLISLLYFWIYDWCNMRIGLVSSTSTKAQVLVSSLKQSMCECAGGGGSGWGVKEQKARGGEEQKNNWNMFLMILHSCFCLMTSLIILPKVKLGDT